MQKVFYLAGRSNFPNFHSMDHWSGYNHSSGLKNFAGVIGGIFVRLWNINWLMWAKQSHLHAIQCRSWCILLAGPTLLISTTWTTGPATITMVVCKLMCDAIGISLIRSLNVSGWMWEKHSHSQVFSCKKCFILLVGPTPLIFTQWATGPTAIVLVVFKWMCDVIRSNLVYPSNVNEWIWSKHSLLHVFSY